MLHRTFARHQAFCAAAVTVLTPGIPDHVLRGGVAAVRSKAQFSSRNHCSSFLDRAPNSCTSRGEIKHRIRRWIGVLRHEALKQARVPVCRRHAYNPLAKMIFPGDNCVLLPRIVQLRTDNQIRLAIERSLRLSCKRSIRGCLPFRQQLFHLANELLKSMVSMWLSLIATTRISFVFPVIDRVEGETRKQEGTNYCT